MATVLVFAGSARQASLNRQLAQAGADAVRAAAAQATLIDLGDFPMPIYHGDLEAADGVPPKAVELGRLIQQHDGLLIASPENNASVSSLLKNTIDWLSRIREFDPLAGKTAALMAASPGAFGGVRGLYHLRAILNTLGVEVIAQQFLLPRAHQAFAADGGFVDPKQAEQLAKFAQRVVRARG
ncbi:MAG: NAD(P)H-dependent oxidoreductase [Burkholderiaceae bacterium]|nr:NAD(P)H-dependent oxidoreductase [Burkholderiaceae bacterium]